LLIEEAINKIKKISTENKGQPGINERLLEELRLLQASLQFSSEFRYWILFCGLFGTETARNPVRLWKDHEKAFIELVRQDGGRGGKQLLQAIVLFFVKRHSAEMLKFAATFMKLMYDQDVFSEEFIIKWYNREVKLDRGCHLYDRKAEKTFKGWIESFVTWLQ
jgi:hypothetical protein